jgi:hypothetical protein
MQIAELRYAERTLSAFEFAEKPINGEKLWEFLSVVLCYLLLVYSFKPC